MTEAQNELEEMMRTMLAYPDQALVQAQACLTLFNFTSGNEHKALLNRLEATKQGALEAIVGAMRNHESQRSVLQWGMRAILNIVSGADLASTERRWLAIRAGAIDATITAMDSSRDDEALQLWGCGALLNLASGADDGASERGEEAVRLGALSAVVNAMHHHPSHKQLQQWGCGFLLNVSAGSDSEASGRGRSVAAVGAVPVVVAAMRAHQREPVLQQWACGVLLNVCAGNDAVAPRLRELTADCGALEVIVKAMEAHVELPQVRSQQPAAGKWQPGLVPIPLPSPPSLPSASCPPLSALHPLPLYPVCPPPPSAALRLDCPRAWRLHGLWGGCAGARADEPRLHQHLPGHVLERAGTQAAGLRARRAADHRQRHGDAESMGCGPAGRLRSPLYGHSWDRRARAAPQAACRRLGCADRSADGDAHASDPARCAAMGLSSAAEYYLWLRCGRAQPQARRVRDGMHGRRR